MRFIAIRHAQTLENTQDLIMGHTPAHLTSHGKNQARAVAQVIKKEKFDFIYCSDLKQCTDTLKAIAKYHQQVPLVFVKELRERKAGRFESHPRGKLHKAFEKFNRHPVYFKAKDGESLMETRKRIAVFLKYLQKNHPKDNLLLMTHESPLRCINSILTKTPLSKIWRMKIDNTSIHDYEIKGSRVKVHRVNDARHIWPK